MQQLKIWNKKGTKILNYKSEFTNKMFYIYVLFLCLLSSFFRMRAMLHFVKCSLAFSAFVVFGL